MNKEQFTDKNGREYARLSALKTGDKVQVDGDFDCMKPRSTKIVQQRVNGELYITCRRGVHALDGQLMGDQDHLIGIYQTKRAP
jgi:hypothetical protein